MATQITNTATLRFLSGSKNHSVASNIATVTLQGPLEIKMHALEAAYQLDDGLVYTISIRNTGSTTLNNVSVTDNLGSYTLADGTIITPLTYLGPAHEYVDGAFHAALTPTVNEHSLVFTINSLMPSTDVLIQYKVITNQYSTGELNVSSIVNTATASHPDISSPVTATYTMPLDAYAKVTIEKSMSPDPITDGSVLTYTFLIKNYGTAPATEVILSDQFTVPPSNLNVKLDSVAIPPEDYEYTSGTLTYPSTTSSQTFDIPAASIQQDPATGEVTIVPSQRIVTVSGTI